jgi:hypothetical protein
VLTNSKKGLSRYLKALFLFFFLNSNRIIKPHITLD